MPAVIRGAVAFVLGSVVLGVAGTALAVAWRGALSPTPRILGRAALGLAACAMVLVGLVLLSNGVEALAGYPLGRWSGASMVVDLWIALELWTRDAALTAALARRRVAWIGALAVWLVTKAALGLAALVTLWAWLGA